MTGCAAAVLVADSEEAAAEALHAARRTDGLPIVVPTPARVDRMLLNAGGLDRDLVIGRVPPSDGLLTLELAAINAVMAGCPAEIFPLVIAACEALVDRELDVGPIQSTTHPIAILTIVNGPARELFGVHSGPGALGPGFRVNATLGRTIRLIMINAGGGIPGIGDMATLGSPAKFSCCLAEAEEDSAFPPLHVSRGFEEAESTVTLLGVEGLHSVVFNGTGLDTDSDMFLRALAAGLSNPASNNISMGRGMVAVILNPTHAQMLAKSGFTRESMQIRLFELAAASRSELRGIVGRMANGNAAPAEVDLIRIVRQPSDILILTGGGEGGAYSAYFPSWGGGADGNNAVTKKVRLDAACEIPISQRSTARSAIFGVEGVE